MQRPKTRDEVLEFVEWLKQEHPDIRPTIYQQQMMMSLIKGERVAYAYHSRRTGKTFILKLWEEYKKYLDTR